MSCEDCEKAQNVDYQTFPYRWGRARIEISACERHAKEVIDALNSIPLETKVNGTDLQKKTNEELKPQETRVTPWFIKFLFGLSNIVSSRKKAANFLKMMIGFLILLIILLGLFVIGKAIWGAIF